jgi:diaminopimelate epimerase
MQFYKYSGSGNDFLFFNNMDGSIKITPTMITNWCRRREGIGADGVILISSSNNNDFNLRIFNADGSEAEMCGNASRCSVHFAKHILNIDKEKYVFDTMNGVYEGESVSGNTVKVKMTELYDVDAIDIKDLSGKRAMYLNTGVPHAVIQVSSVEDVKIKAIGSAIRHDVRFKNGTNVDFFEVIDFDKQVIKLRVYERGVEDETLCCGTGVMATAVACSNFFGWQGEVTVYVRGGQLQAIIDEKCEELYFQGAVELVYSGLLNG